MPDQGTSTIWGELRFWKDLAAPAAIRSFVEMLPWLITLAMLGRRSTLDLSALSMAEAWMYSFMGTSWSAIAMTQSTLVSQAHGARSIGAAQGWTVMTATAAVLLIAVVSGSWFATVPALTTMGLNSTLAKLTPPFTKYALIPLWLETFNLVASTYLIALQFAAWPLLIQLTSAVADAIGT